MKSLVYAAVAVALLFAPSAGQAQNRYAEPPPVLVSPDLSAPWILQLRQGQAERPRHQRQIRPDTAQRQMRRPAVEPRRPASPRVAWSATGLRGVPDRVVPPNPRPYHAGQSDPEFLPQTVPYYGPHAPGTVVVDTERRFLYLVEAGGVARRYGVGVGKPGFEWAGTHYVTQKREWPDWRPPAEMIERERRKGRALPTFVKGGPQNPLGARALYLGSTLYRIHGTNAPWTIGQAVSSGCIRMRNEDVMDLYERVPVGAKVVVI